MTENRAAVLEPNEKQKKILAAKKKLKSFQAKRAAAAETLADGERAGGDGTGAELVDGINGEAYADADGASGTGSRAQVQSREDEADDLAKELEQLKIQINAERKQLEDESKKTRAELQSSREQLSSLEASSAAKEKTLGGLLEEREREIQGLKDDALRAQNEAAQAMDDAHDLHRRELAEREAQLTAEHTAEAAGFTRMIEERDSRIAELVHSAEEARAAYNADIARLTEAAQVAADAAAAKAGQDQQNIADLESKLCAEAERANSGEAQCAELESRKQVLEGTIQRLESDVAAKETALEEAHEHIEEARTAHQEELLNASKRAEAARAEHQTQVLSLNEAIADIKREKSEQEERAAKLEAEVASQNEANNEKSQRIDGLETDLAHVGQIRDTIQAKHDKLVAAQKESRKTIDKISREKTKADEALASMEQTKDAIATQARTDKEEYAAEKAALESTSESLQARVYVLEKQVEDAKNELENEQNTCAQLRDEKKQAHAEIARVASEAKAAEAESAAKAAELGQQLADKKAACKELEDSYAQAQSRIATLEEMNARLEEELQIEAEAAKEAFEELSQEHHDLEQKHSHLSGKHLKAIASTQAWITELQEASARHKDELGSLELESG
ncbi:hypothetical protein IW140_003437 [Coemansia sp. RSA 1813]|nr:hypothetical protein EV178_006119 [Coemansia sp. RSA 1646]KAJ1768566.1 hypothetical protein LPJ74_004766 [Coemansia sp. RSA 1843]KAJ2085799.1 hypothetical protein IW138_006110 [Coemansia sp. RSA 986]KAJ2210667.1 hypothetical protein EV179_006073 [Coemansia sp. RSA 487]KAJ2568931.1 hypothetical protein IW140_003437 [Coemansia sp. RSA 1813]